MPDQLLEKLAALEHEQWSHWMQYFFTRVTTFLGGDIPYDEVHIIMKKEDWKQWTDQLATDYKDLTEKEKESDREWARKVIELLKPETNEIKLMDHIGTEDG